MTTPALGNGTSYARSVGALLRASPPVCTIENACNATALRALHRLVGIDISVDNGARSCVRYAVAGLQGSNWTGGPCFNATASYTVRSRADPSRAERVVGTINEARHIASPRDVGQTTDGPGADWLCLDDVTVEAR